MIPDRLEKVLFLGAGASIPLGLPPLEGLIQPVAEHARAGWTESGTSADRRLAEYLNLVHGVSQQTLSLFFDKRASAMPGIVDILTVLDLAISENSSFGHARREGIGGPEPREFASQELRHAHRTIIGAVSEFVSRGNRKVDPIAEDAYRRLITGFKPHAIITTNWDGIIDRELWGSGDRPETWQASGSWVHYTPMGETVVDVNGKIQDFARADPELSTPLLKLHGSLNWLCCPRCQRLIINAAVDLLPIRDEDWIDDDCWCQAVAEPLVITPSFSKSYNNLHIRAVWREALRALALAKHWVFVGYSLPVDDFAIRSLITRALAWKRSVGRSLRSVLVVDWVPDELKDKASSLATEGAAADADQPPDVRRFLELTMRYRSILAGYAGKVHFSPEGMQVAADIT